MKISTKTQAMACFKRMVMTKVKTVWLVTISPLFLTLVGIVHNFSKVIRFFMKNHNSKKLLCKLLNNRTKTWIWALVSHLIMILFLTHKVPGHLFHYDHITPSKEIRFFMKNHNSKKPLCKLLNNRTQAST